MLKNSYFFYLFRYGGSVPAHVCSRLGQFQNGSSVSEAVPALLYGGKIVVVQVFIKEQKIHLQELSASMNPKYYDITLILQNIYNSHVKSIIGFIKII